MPGSMRQRGKNSWNLRVYAGRDASPVARSPSSERSAATSAKHPRCWPPWWPRSTGGLSHPLGRERWLTSAGSGSTTLLRASRPRRSRRRGCTSRTRSFPSLGSLQVAKLTPSDLDRFYRQLLEVGRSRGPYAPATIRRVHGIIRRALTQGVRWGWITHNPAIDASPPRVPMKELKPPDPGQVVQLFRSGPGVGPRAGHLHHAGRIIGGPER